MLWTGCCVPQKSYVEILSPDVLVLFGGSLGSEDGVFMSEISGLTKGSLESSLALSLPHVRIQQEDGRL